MILPTSAGKFERSSSADEAIRSAESFFKKRGINFTISEKGNRVKTTRCFLNNPDLKTPGGMGKGLGSQSIASAMFEAIEHLCWEFEGPFLETIRLDLSHADSMLNRGSPDLERIFSDHEAYLSRVQFQGIGSDLGSTLKYPYILTNPYFVPTDKLEQRSTHGFSLQRYGTNSGTAAALTVDDAILHGLLELIERDAISIALLEGVIKKPASPMRLVEYVPDSVQQLIDMICSENSVDVTIWDITTDIGIPVALASVRQKKGEGYCRFFGSGASLNMHYAMERAVLEALQCLHAAVFDNLDQPAIINMGNDFPSYMRCGLSRGVFEYTGGDICIDVRNLYALNFDMNSTKCQISFICTQLNRMGIHVFTRPIYEEDVYVYQVVSPQLERFNLVASGVPVIPGFRGRKVLNEVF